MKIPKTDVIYVGDNHLDIKINKSEWEQDSSEEFYIKMGNLLDEFIGQKIDNKTLSKIRNKVEDYLVTEVSLSKLHLNYHNKWEFFVDKKGFKMQNKFKVGDKVKFNKKDDYILGDRFNKTATVSEAYIDSYKRDVVKVKWDDYYQDRFATDFIQSWAFELIKECRACCDWEHCIHK